MPLCPFSVFLPPSSVPRGPCQFVPFFSRYLVCFPTGFFYRFHFMWAFYFALGRPYFFSPFKTLYTHFSRLPPSPSRGLLRVSSPKTPFPSPQCCPSVCQRQAVLHYCQPLCFLVRAFKPIFPAPEEWIFCATWCFCRGFLSRVFFLLTPIALLYQFSPLSVFVLLISPVRSLLFDADHPYSPPIGPRSFSPSNPRFVSPPPLFLVPSCLPGQMRRGQFFPGGHSPFSSFLLSFFVRGPYSKLIWNDF